MLIEVHREEDLSVLWGAREEVAASEMLQYVLRGA